MIIAATHNLAYLYDSRCDKTANATHWLSKCLMHKQVTHNASGRVFAMPVIWLQSLLLNSWPIKQNKKTRTYTLTTLH